MVYLLTVCCMLLAACICVISYIVVYNRLQFSNRICDSKESIDNSDPMDSDSGFSPESEVTTLKESVTPMCFMEKVKRTFTVNPKSRWIVFIVAVLLVGVVSFCAQIFTWGGSGIDTLGFVKIIITSELLMSAAIIDFYTKKIPNFIPIALLVAGAILLIFEFFFMKDSFMLLLGSSMIGLVGSFLILFVMVLVTRGGMGMGDVKLISCMGFITGVAATFYSFIFASILCLLVTIALLITKKKRMKDDLPFGPFIFLAYIVVIVLGLF